jgi:hypothetical protein
VTITSDIHTTLHVSGHPPSNADPNKPYTFSVAPGRLVVGATFREGGKELVEEQPVDVSPGHETRVEFRLARRLARGPFESALRRATRIDPATALRAE